MAIVFVAAGTVESDSISFASHQANDYIFMLAYNSGTGAPTLPAGWASRFEIGNAGRAVNFGVKRAVDASTTSGTWTSATHLVYAIYRSNDGKHLNGGTLERFTAANATNLTYPAAVDYRMVTGTRSRVLGFVGAAVGSSVATPPTGMTNRASLNSNGGVAVHDTNGVVSSWPSTNVATSSTNATVLIVELFETDIDIVSGGGGIYNPFRPPVFGGR